MNKTILVVLLFIGIFASIGLADGNNQTNATNVSCNGNCSYLWGEILSIQWIPNIFTMTGLGNCSLTYDETNTIHNDTYRFICNIAYLNMTKNQEFIFLLIDDLNRDNNILREDNKKIPKLEGMSLAQWIIIIALICVIVYLAYQLYY